LETAQLSKNQHLWELFIETVKSKDTRKRAPSWLHHYMNHFLMTNEKGEPEYDKLLSGDIADIEKYLKHFVIYKKKKGLGAAGIENYINILVTFYKAHGLKKKIDWELIRSYLPEKVRKYKDREYYDSEVWDIEGKCDERGLVVTGVMRGSGIRRGAEGTVSLGDLFPRQTKYGRIYKIWVYRGTKAEYPTACIPDVAKRIDDYQAVRLRFGEVCKQFGKDHYHEYHDGEEVSQKLFRADERHLDPEAPLIREAFDKRDPTQIVNPRRLTEERISDIVREAAIKAGIRVVNKGQKNKRHKVAIAHGFRKLFKKRCRQAGMDAIILERFMGHRSGNPREGMTSLMLTYDPADWTEMEQQFIKVIPHLTLSREAKLEAEKAELENKLSGEEKMQAQLDNLTDLVNSMVAERYQENPKDPMFTGRSNNKEPVDDLGKS